jgi:N-acetylmuramic acid 6-phosphate etherase
MPPTFGTPPEMVRAHIAGGTLRSSSAVEGAEDDAASGNDAMLECVRARRRGARHLGERSRSVCRRGDCSREAIGAYTIALTADAQSALARAAELAIVPPTGAEVLAGSTRLKAGTAQKVALNAISTAVMVRLGKVHDNLMVDVVANNHKLRARALRLVVRLAQVNEQRAEELLVQAGGSVKIAVVMARRTVGATQARALLEQNDGMLRQLL